MSMHLDRRHFFLRSLAVASASALECAPSRARADAYHPFDFELLEGDYRWPDDYRRTMVRETMWIINHRFLDVENVVQNVLDVTKDGYYFSDTAWNNLRPRYPEMTSGDHLLWYQLLSLRSWMSPPDPRPGPKVKLFPAWSQANFMAWATYDTVTISGHDDKIRVEGDFIIALNGRFLGSAGYDSWQWAAIIAHEMLHSLGHKHEPDPRDPKFYLRQINVFEAALYYGNRRYRRGMRTPDVRCGGRRP
jgi:hypothetical protein